MQMLSLDRFRSCGLEEEIIGSASERRDMYDRWLAFLGRHLFTYTLASGVPKEPGFHIHARSRRADGFTLARFVTTKGKSQLHRGPTEISVDNRDSYVIYISLQGQIELTQFGRKQFFEPCSAAMVSATERISHIKLGDNDTLCFAMPREFVDQRVVRGEDLCVRPAGGSGIQHMFTNTMLAFQSDAPQMTNEQFSGAARLVGELALLALSGSLDVMSNLRSVRTSNLARVKRVIRRQFANPELTLSNVAAECGLSLRYLHDLFRDDGRTAREYLTSERLQHARRMLESASDSTSTVTSISMACGFANSSQFSTTFRRTFGLSPRDVLRRR
jgi:AraC-like DNA-binding protein